MKALFRTQLLFMVEFQNLTSPHGLLAVALASFGIALLLMARKPLQGTTLLAPLWWCVISLAMVAIAQWLLGPWEENSTGGHAAFRFAAAATTCCPSMALLGAKRPQDRGWQFVVLALWVILVLPVGETLLFSPNAQIELGWPRGSFLLGLILFSCLNQLPTRYALCGASFAGAQLLLLGHELPVTHHWLSRPYPLWALSLMVFSVALAHVIARRRRSLRDPLDHLWLNFRDAFGAVWALRVVERVNNSAQLQNWPIRLTWQGFVAAEETSEGLVCDFLSENREAVEQVMRSLLWRFVPRDWSTLAPKPGTDSANQTADPHPSESSGQ